MKIFKMFEIDDHRKYLGLIRMVKNNIFIKNYCSIDDQCKYRICRNNILIDDQCKILRNNVLIINVNVYNKFHSIQINRSNGNVEKQYFHLKINVYVESRCKS